LDKIPQPSVATKQRTKPAPQETVDSQAERETDPDAAEEATAPNILKRPLFLGIGIGVVTLLLATAVTVFLLVRGGDQPEEPSGAAATAQPEPADGIEPEAGTEQAKRNEAYLTLDWPRKDRVGGVLEIDGKPRDIAGLMDPADPDRLKLQVDEGAHRVWIARKGYEHFIEEIKVAAGEEFRLSPEWKSLAVLPMAEEKVEATPPSEAQPAPPAPDTSTEPEPPEEMVEAIPAEPAPPIVAQADAVLEQRRALEAKYANATASAVELIAAWDYPRAYEALTQIRFDEEELAARLTIWLHEIRRMAELKAKIIASINEADPPLKKSDISLRGQNGQITRADEKGIEAKLALDKVEHYAWGDLQPKATAKLLRSTADTQSRDELLAAALIAYATGGYPLAEEFLADARSLGIDIDPYLNWCAETDFSRAIEFLNQEQYSEAAAALKELEESYGNTPWFAENKMVWEAALSETEPAMVDRETEGSEAQETVIASGITGLKYRATFAGHPTTVEFVGFTPDGRFLVSLCQGMLYVWNTEGIPSRMKCDVRGRITFSPDATTFAGIYTQDRKSIAVIGSRTGGVVQVIQGHAEYVTSVVFSPDGKSLASGSVDMTVRLWLVAGGGRVLLGHTGTVNALEFAPDGSMLASGSDDQTIRLWDTSTGEETGILRGHTRPVLFVSFLPNGDRVISVSEDQIARIWDVKTFEELLQFKCVGSPAVSPDGETFACADGESITLWNTKTGEESLKIAKHSPGTGALAFSPDGKTLVSLSDLSIDLWDIESKTQVTEETSGQSTSPE
jgi:WD40 repeat protein